MKTTSVVCDLHPSCELRPPELLDLRSSAGDWNKMCTQRCSNPTCNRHYTTEFGYISVKPGEFIDLELERQKVRCDVNHGQDDYMVLTKIDGVLTWACPVEDCQATKPYGAMRTSPPDYPPRS